MSNSRFEAMPFGLRFCEKLYKLPRPRIKVKPTALPSLLLLTPDLDLADHEITVGVHSPQRDGKFYMEWFGIKSG